MTVNELIKELREIAAEGHGDTEVIISSNSDDGSIPDYAPVFTAEYTNVRGKPEIRLLDEYQYADQKAILQELEARKEKQK